jgi:dTDP-4-dehydrorhamnose reductase
MRALVIGASGQVGGALCLELARRGHSVVGTHAHVAAPGTVFLDLADAPATERMLSEFAPDWVFCAGALTHVEYCEAHPDEAARLNRDGPRAAARAAAQRGAGFLFYSTEYVFDGTAGPYAEGDRANPLSVYGRTKWEGEGAVQEAHPRGLIVRTTVVYGPERQEKNFVYQVIRQCRSGQPMQVAADQVSSPTFSGDLAAASVELAERGAVGVYHVAGTSVLDRYAFAQMAAEVFGLDGTRLRAVPTAHLGQQARRPLRGGLRVERSLGILTTPLRSARDGLAAMRETIAPLGKLR